MTLDAVVADANVLLSAAVGKAARKIFTKSNLRIHVTEFNASEVEEYLPRLALKYELPVDLALLQWRLLPLTRHGMSDYARFFGRAVADIKESDREDAHALALARTLDLPLWSNDKHLRNKSVPVYPTAKLLRVLGII